MCTDNPSEIANSFNNFFVNTAAKIKEPINSTNHDKLKEFCKSKISIDTQFKIPSMDGKEVLKYLSNIDISKATGTDNTGSRLLKLAAPLIAADITFICNKSIGAGCFPNKWKEAKISPLHKNGPHDDLNNYRPISILPILSKSLKNMCQTISLAIWMAIIYFIKLSPISGQNTHVKLHSLI